MRMHNRRFVMGFVLVFFASVVVGGTPAIAKDPAPVQIPYPYDIPVIGLVAVSGVGVAHTLDRTVSAALEYRDGRRLNRFQADTQLSPAHQAALREAAQVRFKNARTSVKSAVKGVGVSVVTFLGAAYIGNKAIELNPAAVTEGNVKQLAEELPAQFQPGSAIQQGSGGAQLK